MTYLPSLLDFDQRTEVSGLIEATGQSAQKLRDRSWSAVGLRAVESVEATPVERADVPKQWTADEIALATFWVAG